MPPFGGGGRCDFGNGWHGVQLITKSTMSSGVRHQSCVIGAKPESYHLAGGRGVPESGITVTP
jgi:hypothetical protein